MEKAEETKIIQIVTAFDIYESEDGYKNTTDIYGLGSDGKVYFWNRKQGKWFLHSYE